MLADVDAIQNFLVLRRHLGEELYLIDPCYASFAPFACVSSKEARQLKQTFDEHGARHNRIFRKMTIENPAH